MFKKLKIVLFTIGLTLLSSTDLLADGTYTVGADQTYETLKDAFDAINAGTISGVLVLEIAADCSESASAVLNASGSGSASYTSINIYPTGATRTISGDINGHLIRLNGADNVVINGRLGGAGTQHSLIIDNESTGASASTIVLQTDATNNTIQYCRILGGTTGTYRGILYFGSASSGGNDDNTIEYNKFYKTSAGYPTSIISSSGTSGHTNSGNTIRGNEITDFSINGIDASSYTDTWTITSNHLYQNNGSTQFAGIATIVKMIWVAGSDFTITSNYLGGQEVSCGGAAFDLNIDQYFYGIHSQSTGTNNISSNVFQNITYTTSTSFMQCYLINLSTAGDYTIGSIGNGNIFGSTTGTGSIVVTLNDQTSQKFACIFSTATGTINMNYNSIGAITVAGTSTGGNYDLINQNGNGTTTISHNTIGNTTADNLTCSINIQTSLINLNSTANNQSITNNTIQNCNWTSTAATTYIHLILFTSTGTGLIISGNIIGNANANNMKIAAESSSISAINTASAGSYSITDNVIRNINCSSTATSCGFTGFNSGHASAVISDLSNNTIENITLNFGTSSAFTGIKILGEAVVNNNTIDNITSSGTGWAKAIDIGNANNYSRTITNNTISNFSVSNVFSGIECSSTSASNTISNNVIGLDEVDNIVSNRATSEWHYGIRLHSSGTFTCNENTIRNITLSGTNAHTLIGIGCTSTGTYNLSGNEIQNLKMTDTGASNGRVYGIYFSSANASSLVQKNRMTGLSCAQTSTPIVAGIYHISTGTVTLQNNVITTNNGGNTSNCLLYGIGATSTATMTLYHNTISIGGSPSSGSSLSSPFYYNGATADRILACKNNIFQNNRTNSGTATGKHYSYYVNTAASMTAGACDYNFYYAPVDADFARAAGASRTAAVFNVDTQGYGGTNSKYSLVIAITQSTGYVPDATTSDISGTGTDLFTSSTVTDDFNGTTRSTSPWIGAFESATPLPITLLSFTAQLSNNIVTVNWSTASEMNNDYFIVERSADGYNFEFLAQVQGGGNTTSLNHYSTLDRSPYSGVSYYRLTQVDYDGESETFTPVSVVNPTATMDNISIYPNPASHSFAVVLQAKNSETVTINIIDLTGKLIRQEQHELVRGENGLIFKVENELSRGTYIIQVDSQFSRFAPQRVVVQ
jgi:hypothetical protein